MSERPRRRSTGTSWLGTAAILVGSLAFAFFGTTDTRETTGGRYVAMATPREGRWVARAENDLEAGLGTVHATLAERIIERGALSPGRGSTSSRRLWFVDERVSRVTVTFNGLDFAAELRELESKLAGTLGPSQLSGALESPELASIPGLTHTPAEQAAAREAVLVYFAEERPDLVDRLRRGEVERVMYRSSISSRQAFWGGLGAAVVLGALAWRRAGNVHP